MQAAGRAALLQAHPPAAVDRTSRRVPCGSSPERGEPTQTNVRTHGPFCLAGAFGGGAGLRSRSGWLPYARPSRLRSSRTRNTRGGTTSCDRSARRATTSSAARERPLTRFPPPNPQIRPYWSARCQGSAPQPHSARTAAQAAARRAPACGCASPRRHGRHDRRQPGYAVAGGPARSVRPRSRLGHRARFRWSALR